MMVRSEASSRPTGVQVVCMRVEPSVTPGLGVCVRVVSVALHVLMRMPSVKFRSTKTRARISMGPL